MKRTTKRQREHLAARHNDRENRYTGLCFRFPSMERVSAVERDAIVPLSLSLSLSSLPSPPFFFIFSSFLIPSLPHTLLSLHTQRLFETHTIDEVRVIERERRVDILRKGSELRQYVGGRSDDVAASAAAVLSMRKDIHTFRQSLARINGVHPHSLPPDVYIHTCKHALFM